MRHAYDDAIYNLGDHEGGADGVMLCGGALRGDSRYGPGTPHSHCLNEIVAIPFNAFKMGK